MEVYDTYTTENGVVCNYVDMGVEYTYNGKRLTVTGEYDTGEVWVSVDATDETLLHGDYERDEDGNTQINWGTGAVSIVCNGEEDWELFAFEMLS